MRDFGLLFRVKSILAILLVLVFSLSVTACSKTASTGGTDVVELRLAHFFPGTHPAEVEFVQGWAARVEEATGGKVKIVSYPGETLLKGADVYNGVVEGVADIGLSCFSYTRGRFPVLEVFELPGIVYKNSSAASKAAWEGIKQLNPKEVQDTKLMMVVATGPGDLFTKTPVRKLEDMGGMEIRATGLSAVTIEALGGIPVAMPQSDAYEALSKGVVKGNLSPVEVLKAWRHAEVTDYLTRTPFLYNTLFFVTMNIDKWNSLPEDVQEAILQVNEEFLEEVGIGLWDKQNEGALEWAVNEQGMEIIELSDEETARWIKAVEPVQQERIAEIEQLDDETLKLVKELAEKYNKKY